MPYPQLQRAGNFRCYPTEWGIATSKNGSVEWVAKVNIVQEWLEAGQGVEEAGWYETADLPQETYARVCLVTTKNQLNRHGVDQLRDAIQWDGNWDALNPIDQGGNDWRQTMFQIEVKMDTYEGKTRAKVNWVRGADDPVSGGLKTLAADEVKKLASHWSSHTLPLCGGQHSVPPPPGKPKAPARQPAPAPVASTAAPSGDDIPFNGAGA